MRFSTTDWISGTLAIVGALNWGLVGLFNFNIVHFLFGWWRPLERAVYATVGVAGGFFLFSLFRSATSEPDLPVARIDEREPLGIG